MRKAPYSPLPPRGNRPTLAPTSPNLPRFVPHPGFEQWADPRRCGQPSRRPLRASASAGPSRLALPSAASHRTPEKQADCAKAQRSFRSYALAAQAPLRRNKAEASFQRSQRYGGGWARNKARVRFAAKEKNLPWQRSTTL